MTVLAWALASATVEGDAAKARKKLDDDYVPVTTRELANRVTRADLKLVALLIEAGVDVNAPDDDGAVPLHAAAGADRTPSAMPLLVKAGTRLDSVGRGRERAQRLGRDAALSIGLVDQL
jgi:ankyrin repeat protein